MGKRTRDSTEVDDDEPSAKALREDYGSFGSSETVKSELAVFNGPSYQVTHLKGQWQEFRPVNQYQGSSGSNIIFKLTQSVGWYLDFNDTYMTITAKIVNAAGGDVADTSIVAFENFGIATLFRDVCFSTTSQTKLEGEQQNYHYRAYMYALLNASHTAKKYQLSISGWASDTAGAFEDASIKNNTGEDKAPNKGFYYRYQRGKASNPVQFAGQVYLDTWLQPQYFMDGQDFDLTFKLNNPEIALHCAEGDATKYKIEILDCALYLRQVQVSASVISGHARGLQTHNYTVNYNGHKMFTKIIKAQGYQDVTDDFFHGVYPKCIIIGLVDHEAYQGRYSLNPYNFQAFDVNEIGLTVNGFPIPAQPYTPNYEKSLIAREYYNLFLQLNKFGFYSDDNGLTMKDFVGGNALYAFNMAPDLAICGHAQLARLTNIRLTIKFAKAIPKPLEVVALAIYDTSLEMTGDRRWLLDPSQSAN